MRGIRYPLERRIVEARERGGIGGCWRAVEVIVTGDERGISTTS
jgi:hypothetical protein